MGTFRGLQGQELSEGDLFVTDEVRFRISYRGGDGNDVELTALGPAEVPTASRSSYWIMTCVLAVAALKLLKS